MRRSLCRQLDDSSTAFVPHACRAALVLSEERKRGLVDIDSAVTIRNYKMPEKESYFLPAFYHQFLATFLSHNHEMANYDAFLEQLELGM